MQEIILQNKKNGMLVLFSCILVELLGVAGIILSAEQEILWLLIPSIIVVCVAWFPLCGLRVLKPQEALVLTLFGKYIGTIKGEGFYAINPFCSAVNPAASTKLSQSGDVTRPNSGLTVTEAGSVNLEVVNKKISLKISSRVRFV